MIFKQLNGQTKSRNIDVKKIPVNVEINMQWKRFIKLQKSSTLPDL